jgi:tRNA U34 5-methylaminomethyl-2-thiouridine-forming methyltransferase MnmC
MATKARPVTPRSQKLLEKVYLQLGANALRERWIDDTHGVLGLAEPGVITISPASLVPVIIHEALHRAYPESTERAVDAMTSYTYHRMSDDDCKRIMVVWASKSKRIKKATTAE